MKQQYLLRIMFCCALVALASCSKSIHVKYKHASVKPVSGSSFYRQAAAYNWKQRDSLFMQFFGDGNVPGFFFRFNPIHVNYVDSAGHNYKITFYCSPDYAMIGTNDDWARVPLTLMAAQALADSLRCFLPTRKMVDLIYQNSKVKLEPVPMYAYRDSTVTMWQHHLIIEGQRQGKKGLISGIKKDIVNCSEAAYKGKENRIAIYGWHRRDGKPIQPLYTGHVNWYADYSHGARMIYGMIKVNHQWMQYKEVFNNPLLRPALSDETGRILFNYSEN